MILNLLGNLAYIFNKVQSLSELSSYPVVGVDGLGDALGLLGLLLLLLVAVVLGGGAPAGGRGRLLLLLLLLQLGDLALRLGDLPVNL